MLCVPIGSRHGYGTEPTAVLIIGDPRRSLRMLKSTVLMFVSLIILFLSHDAIGAEEYAKGHGALQVFDAEGMAATPLWVQMWVGFMLVMFATGLFAFAWKQPLARWVAGGFILSALFGESIFNAFGLPFLSGSIAILHLVFWTPGLILLLMQRPFLDPEQGKWFRIWSGMMVVSILFSYVFDIRDATIYLNHVI